MNTQTLTPAEQVRKEFKAVLGLAHVVDQNSGSDQYYIYQEKLKAKMIEFLRTDFSVLNTKQFLKLAALVSTHRPVAPHSFLITCSNLIGE